MQTDSIHQTKYSKPTCLRLCNSITTINHRTTLLQGTIMLTSRLPKYKPLHELLFCFVEPNLSNFKKTNDNIFQLIKQLNKRNFKTRKYVSCLTHIHWTWTCRMTFNSDAAQTAQPKYYRCNLKRTKQQNGKAQR